MKGGLLYRYESLSRTGFSCLSGHTRNVAFTSAMYSLNVSILVVLLYCWRISVNVKRFTDLQDVYLGVQIAYFAIVWTQIFMIVLSMTLMVGICKESTSLIAPWIIGFITFMALEGVAMVYSNVLRDHVNRQFDSLCKAEVAFFLSRCVLNMFAIYGVMRFYNLVRSGITWKDPEAIEL